MIKILKNCTYVEVILIFVILIFTLCQTYLDLLLPDYMAEITLLVQAETDSMSAIYIAGLQMIGCAIGSFITCIIVAVLAARIASNISNTLRKRLFGKVVNFSMQDINEFSTSSLIIRTTNDVTQVQTLIVTGAQMLIKAPITAVWAIVKIAGKNMQWTATTIIAVAVLIVMVSICLGLAMPRFAKIQKLTDNINKTTKEQLDGLPVIRAYNAQDYQEQKFEKANKELTGVNLFTSKTMSFMMPTMQLVSSGLVLAIYLVGSVLINSALGSIKYDLFSDMVVFTGYAIQVVLSFMMLVMVFMILPRALVSAKRIVAVLETHESIEEGLTEEGIEGKLGEVEFKNVSFKYPDASEYMLKNVSFKASLGETIAFIGSTGSGKSTAINLIPRFYDVTEGEVFVNGRNVKDYTKKALNNMVGYVSQKALLFKGSIRSNVLLGSDDDTNNIAEIQKAISIAQADDFVSNIDNGLDAYVAQNGGNLSGGQKQRLSIARAIYKNANIIIFDDSFSALDYKTDSDLRNALAKESDGTTRIIVGQRIGTIMGADTIIVLEDGKIVGNGKHKDLLKSCDLYYKIALSQLSEEELNDAR